MQNSLDPSNDSSKQKILSTENSNNSTFNALLDDKDRTSPDSSFRLFTFMKEKNEDLDIHKSKTNLHKKKLIKNKHNKSMKREASGLITIIEESRRKREDFYKLILDSQSLSNLQNGRKCRTPSQLKISTNNHSLKFFNSKKSTTPRVSIHRQDSLLGLEVVKNEKKVLQGKDQNVEGRASMKKQKGKNMGAKTQRPSNNNDKDEELVLLKKKKQLQKQLLQINQTLLLGYQKKRSKVQKSKK